MGMRVGWGRGVGSKKEIKSSLIGSTICEYCPQSQKWRLELYVLTNRVMFPLMSPMARRLDEGWASIAKKMLSKLSSLASQYWILCGVVMVISTCSPMLAICVCVVCVCVCMCARVCGGVGGWVGGWGVGVGVGVCVCVWVWWEGRRRRTCDHDICRIECLLNRPVYIRNW